VAPELTPAINVITFGLIFAVGNVWIHEVTQTFARPCDVFRDHEVSLEYEIIK